MMKLCRIFAVALLLAVSSGVLAHAQEEDFNKANKFYEDKDFDSAIGTYESILDRNVESAALYYNLGNAYFKKGDLGHAILYYMKAKRLDPSDEAIRHNLEFASQFSRVRMEGVTLNPIDSFIGSIVDPYRLNTLAWISSLLFILFFVFLILRYGIGMWNTMTKVGAIVSLILLVSVAGLTTFKYRTDYLTKRAVILSDDSPVYTGPSDQSDKELDGAPGLVVKIVDQSGDYYNVLFENMRRGWIKKDLVAII